MSNTMKKFVISALLFSLIGGGAYAQKKASAHGYPIDPVPFTSVKLTDSFWGQRLKASREVTIPLAFSKCEETGRYKNFEMAAHPSENNKVTGYSFDDTDVYKTIEGASYLLQTYPGLKKLSVRTHGLLRPTFAVMNPELTYTLPAWQTACGVTDMMAHIMERYFTNTKDVEIGDRLCEGTLLAIIKEATTVMKEPENYGARANLMWCGTIAHNGTCGVGCEED